MQILITRIINFKIIIQYTFQNAEDNDTKNNTLPGILYGCETWYFTLGEEHKLLI
jgi:hypothetical protein